MYKNLFRTMELGVVYHDSNGKIIELNPAASRILGLTKTQISSLDSFSPDWDSIKEDGTPFPGNEHPAIAALRTGKTVKNVVMGILHQKKKKRIWIKINAVPEFKKGREKPYKVYASFADITDEKLAKESLKESEESLQRAFDVATLGHWKLNLKTLEYTWSDFAKKIIGYNKKKNFPSHTNEYETLFYPDDLPMVLAEIEKAEAMGEFSLDHRLIINNKIKWVRIKSKIVFDKENTPSHAIGIIRDITEQKENEIARNESDKLKTAFLNNMSHEIRTPLNVIMGYAGLLSEEEGNGNEKVKSYSEPIIRSTVQLQKIIDDILNLSRMDAGQLIIQNEEVDINEIIDELLVEHELNAKAKNLNLLYSKKLSKKAPKVFTDKVKLIQVLNNLISNSIKYTDKGIVKIGAVNKVKDIQIVIEDSGRGIDSKYHSKIFKRFQRLDIEKSDNYHSVTHGGTGLGLAISKGLVELLGGEIWFKSEKDKGSKFYFTIPKKRKKNN